MTTRRLVVPAWLLGLVAAVLPARAQEPAPGGQYLLLLPDPAKIPVGGFIEVVRATLASPGADGVPRTGDDIRLARVACRFALDATGPRLALLVDPVKADPVEPGVWVTDHAVIIQGLDVAGVTTLVAVHEPTGLRATARVDTLAWFVTLEADRPAPPPPPPSRRARPPPRPEDVTVLEEPPPEPIVLCREALLDDALDLWEAIDTWQAARVGEPLGPRALEVRLRRLRLVAPAGTIYVQLLGAAVGDARAEALVAERARDSDPELAGAAAAAWVLGRCPPGTAELEAACARYLAEGSLPGAPLGAAVPRNDDVGSERVRARRGSFRRHLFLALDGRRRCRRSTRGARLLASSGSPIRPGRRPSTRSRRASTWSSPRARAWPNGRPPRRG